MMRSQKLVIPFVIILFLHTFGWGQYKDASNEFSYAVKLYDQQFYDLAAQQFIKFYTSYPNSSNIDEAKFYAGMSLFILGQYNKSRIEFQSLALEFPKSTKAGESWFKVGECYENLDNPAEAAKSFETLKTLYPQDPLAAQALYKAGINYVNVNDLQKAKSVFTAIFDRYEESAVYNKAMIELALVYKTQNNSATALNYLDKVLQNSSNGDDLARAAYAHGLIELEDGYFNIAEADFLTIVNRFPKSEYTPQAMLYLGKINLQNNNYAKAIEYLSKVPENEIKSSLKKELILLKGDTYYLDNKFALAEKEYLKVAESENDSLKLVNTLKLALSQKKQNLQSKATITLSALFSSGNVQSRSAFQTFLIYLDWLEADQNYNIAISIIQQKLKTTLEDEDRYLLVSRLAGLYKKKGRWTDLVREIKPFVFSSGAIKYIDEYIFNLAVAHQNLGEYEESADYFKILLNQYSASPFYDTAEERYTEIQDYHLVDYKNATHSNLSVWAAFADNNKKDEIPFFIGKIYYNDLKDYNNARSQFLKSVEKDINHKGDAYLFLGKSLLKLSNDPRKKAQESLQLLVKASENFKLAVENLNTCATPDEASWFMVQTRVAVDTLSVQKQKTYIEALISKYPESTFKETWYSTLAHDLAFETGFFEDSKKYFKELISQFKNSQYYPSYLLGYAKLMSVNEPESATDMFKNIALEYSESHEAVQALYEVAQFYEDTHRNKEAISLYKMLQERYYYTNLADIAGSKIAELSIQEQLYDDAIPYFTKTSNHPFINDLVLSKEFLSPNIKEMLVYLGIANKKQEKFPVARTYFTRYLSLEPSGKLRSRASFELAEIYYNQGNTDLAINNFSSVSKKDSSLYNQALLFQADIQFKKQNFIESAKIYRELSSIYINKPQEKEIKGNYILSQIKNGQINDSEKEIQAYKKRFPDAESYHAAFTIELGEFERKNKNFDKALSYYRTVTKKYSDTPSVDDADYYTALTYITLNKNEEAFEILTGFYNKYPKSDKLPFALNSLGALYFRGEQYDNAISIFKNALKLSQDSELKRQVMGNLIKTYTLTGFWDAAQGLARQYVEEFPEAEDRLDKKLVIAQAFSNLNQFQNAVEYLKRMKLEADSEREPEIQFYIGEAHLKAGEYEEAIAEFVKIPLLSRQTKLQWEASALYYSGQAYEKLGRIPDAVRMYKEIISRPGIDQILKRDAEKRITQIQG